MPTKKSIEFGRKIVESPDFVKMVKSVATLLKAKHKIDEILGGVTIRLLTYGASDEYLPYTNVKRHTIWFIWNKNKRMAGRDIIVERTAVMENPSFVYDNSPNHVDVIDLKDEIDHALNSIPQIDRRIICSLVVDEESQEVTAQNVGYNRRQGISERKPIILKRMRAAIS